MNSPTQNAASALDRAPAEPPYPYQNQRKLLNCPLPGHEATSLRGGRSKATIEETHPALALGALLAYPGSMDVNIDEDAAMPMAPRTKHDAFSSLSERVQDLGTMTARTRSNVLRALSSIDSSKREDFLAKHREKLENLDTMAAAKYADFAYWAYLSVLAAQWLGLDRAEPLDILDIGMGSGSFVMVANSMGHRAIGTDLPDPWYEELCLLTGAERVIAPVHRGEPYKPVERQFDLVTIMLPAFHRKRIAGKREYWSVEDWRAFLLQVVHDLVKPAGAIFVMMPLDKNDDGKLSYSPLLEWARERGARLDRTFRDGAVRHILFDPATESTFAKEPPQVIVKSDIPLELPE